jgi:hypothetical protein
MIRNLTLLVLGAAALAACNPNPTTVVANEAPDPMAAELANAPAIELPPAIAASKTYRCKDNSLVKIDWLAGGQGANLRVGDATTAVALRAAAPAAEGGNEVAAAPESLTAEGGYALKGVASASNVALTLPGKGALTCHV